MKPVTFTGHALEKMRLAQASGFGVNEETVVKTVREPQELIEGYGGRSIAQITLDTEHVLRVVYEEDSEIIIITVYPGRRRRYED